jgi:hypothetical protein
MAAPLASVKSEIHLPSSPDFLLFACDGTSVEAGVNS